MKKCTVGKRHKWEFVRNVSEASFGCFHASFSLKGLYKCACGATKHGVNQ